LCSQILSNNPIDEEASQMKLIERRERREKDQNHRRGEWGEGGEREVQITNELQSIPVASFSSVCSCQSSEPPPLPLPSVVAAAGAGAVVAEESGEWVEREGADEGRVEVELPILALEEVIVQMHQLTPSHHIVRGEQRGGGVR
jgi:hypothetical protein